MPSAIQWLTPPDPSGTFRDDVRPIRIFLHGRLDAIRDQIKRTPVALSQVALAYERWGSAPTSFAERLSGEFVLVILNEHSRELLFIRDPLGIEPFYYAQQNGTLWFGSELSFIHAHVHGAALNEGFIAEWLSGTIMTRSETIFSGIQRLPPGSLLRISHDGVSVERYWFPERAPELKTSDPKELQERFLALLQQAIARRAAEGPAAAELSGGLDSSAVACLARKANLVQHAYSLVFADQSCDERQHASAVAKFAQLEWHPIEARPVELSFLRQTIREHHALPLHPTSAVSLPLLQAMARDGASVGLSGQGGDDLLTGSLRYPEEQLLCGHWLEFIRDARSGPNPPGLLRQLKRTLSRLLRKPAVTGFSCASPELAQATNLVERLRLSDPPEKWESPCRADMFNELSGGFLATSLEEQALVFSCQGMKGRHPFYDRDLYEFCLMLPEHERQSRRVGKQLFRRAMQGLMPESICARADKAEFSAVLAGILAQADADGTLELPELSRTKWLDSERVRRLTHEYRQQLQQPNGRKASVLNQLWTLLALELFLQEWSHTSRSINVSSAPLQREDLLNVGT